MFLMSPQWCMDGGLRKPFLKGVDILNALIVAHTKTDIQQLKVIIAGDAVQRWTEVKKMAEYHVGCGAFGIYAGTLEPKNKSLWRNKSDVTEEAIEAVRDHMVMELLGGFNCSKASSSGWAWKLKDGRTVELRVTIKEDEENGNQQ